MSYANSSFIHWGRKSKNLGIQLIYDEREISNPAKDTTIIGVAIIQSPLQIQYNY